MAAQKNKFFLGTKKRTVGIRLPREKEFQMDMIGFDMYYQHEPSRVSMLDTGTPESARDVPCDGCPMMEDCGAKMLECVAFRQWSADGDFMDKDMARLRRAMK
jgi:hypothetical protein